VDYGLVHAKQRDGKAGDSPWMRRDRYMHTVPIEYSLDSLRFQRGNELNLLPQQDLKDVKALLSRACPSL
jgi:hypothetical protein